MNKAISVAALLALASASNDFSDNSLNFLSKVKEDLKKAGHFVAEHPEIITTAIKLIKDDEVADEELFHIPKPTIEAKIHFDEAADAELNAKDVFKKIGQGLLTGVKIASKFLDDETADQELFKIPKPKVDIGVHFDEDGNELFDMINPRIGRPVVRPIHVIYDDEELFKIPKPTIEAKIHFDENGNELFKIPTPKLNIGVHFDENGNELFRSIPGHSMQFDDEELFKIPKPTIEAKIHFDENGNELFKIPTPKLDIGVHFDENGNELFRTIPGHSMQFDDEELFKIPKPTIEAKIHFDENGNELFDMINPRIGRIGHPVVHPIHVIYDDEELFKIPKPTIEGKIHFDEAADAELNAKDVFKKIGNGLLTGVKIASKFLDDETADQELFKIPKPTIEAKIHFDEQAENELFDMINPRIGHHVVHPIHVVYDDEELFKIPKPKVDIGVHFDENGNELFHIPKPTIEAKIHFDEQAENELFAPRHNQTQHHGAVKKAQRDVKHASELLRKVHNLHHQRNSTQHDSLSNLGQLLHEGRQIHHNYI